MSNKKHLCPDRTKIRRYLDQKLTAVEVSFVERHLKRCPGCRMTLRNLTEDARRKEVKEMREEPPPAQYDPVAAQATEAQDSIDNTPTTAPVATAPAATAPAATAPVATAPVATAPATTTPEGASSPPAHRTALESRIWGLTMMLFGMALMMACLFVLVIWLFFKAT